MSKKISDEVAFDLKAVLNDRLQQVIDEVVAEFTTPEPSIPAGTKVRVLEDEAYYASVSKGDIGTVIRATEWADEEGEVIVTIDGGDGTEWTFRPGVDIEVVTEFQIAEEKAKAAFPFKAGDKVRILEDDAWLAPVKAGDLATVNEIVYSTYNGAYCSAEVEGKGSWYFRAQDIEAVNDTIEVGDTVEVPASHNHMWAGKGTVTKVVTSYGAPYAIVEMQTGPMADAQGGFDLEALVLVGKAATAEPAFAVGDRVFTEDYGFGTVEQVDDESCCGDDEVKVVFDGGRSEWFGFDGQNYYGSPLESLDERELVPLNEWTDYVKAGDELILITKAGDTAPIEVGEKVTVLFNSGGLITAETADGRRTNRYVRRFARA